MSADPATLDVQNVTDVYNATVIERISLTSLMIILRIQPDQMDFSFTPGQFTVLGLKRSALRVPEADEAEPVPQGKENRLIRRAYSITSGTQERDYLEFYISLLTSGELTPRLFYLLPGDRLFVGSDGKGVFNLDHVPANKNILLVGTGTGLAPYMSMLRSMALGLSCPVASISVLHGASYSWDLGYRSELESLMLRCQKFRYLPVISRPQVDTSWRGRTGHLQDLMARPNLEELCGVPIHPNKTYIFLCGHPEMVEAVIPLLTPKGYTQGSRQEPGSLHLEKYW